MTSNSQHKIVDHLFRHQFGKMIAIMTKIFGPAHLELIEDAIQDTFIQAALKWRAGLPENPEAWLTQAAKNRTVDLIRQINAQKEREEKTLHPSVAFELNDYFLDHEVRDSQLRMIFLACHPSFSQDEQIAFALKCISGFSLNEIAAALMQKEETIKKRLNRAKKKIKEQKIILDYPAPDQIQNRLSGVLQTIYLIFNEGFHSTKQNQLVDKELCGEALRLCKNLLIKEKFRSAGLYGLFALLCYHSARIESKIVKGRIIDLEVQDRKLWYQPLIELGHQSLLKAHHYNDRSIYCIEAEIAKEHVISACFEATNWKNILTLYDEMYVLTPSDQILISKATIYIHCNDFLMAERMLKQVVATSLKKRKYLLHGAWAKLYEKQHKIPEAIDQIKIAISECSNEFEKVYLNKRKEQLYGLN